MDEGEKFQIQIILNSYTSKILRYYYTDKKQFPSIVELKQMQQETIDESQSEAWKQGIVALITPRKRD